MLHVELVRIERAKKRTRRCGASNMASSIRAQQREGSGFGREHLAGGGGVDVVAARAIGARGAGAGDRAEQTFDALDLRPDQDAVAIVEVAAAARSFRAFLVGACQ